MRSLRDEVGFSGAALLSSRQTIVGDVRLQVARGHQVATVTVQGQGVVECCLASNPYIYHRRFKTGAPFPDRGLPITA